MPDNRLLADGVDRELDPVPGAARVHLDDAGIAVTDNGPGIPSETVTDVLDFSVRISSREAYVAPDRGAQGNALKTIVAMPFVLDGELGRIEVATNGQASGWWPVWAISSLRLQKSRRRLVRRVAR